MRTLAAVIAAAAMATTLAAAPAAQAQLSQPASAALGAGSSAPVPLPQHDPFYRYEGTAPLASHADGDPLKQRTTQLHFAGMPTPLRAEQVLYKTTDAAGKAHATATTVIVPPQPTGKVVSFQSAYDSLAPDCQPSHALAGGFDRGVIATAETALMAPFLAKGYTVVTSDFEGQNPHFANGITYARGTLDGIRAAGRSPHTTVTPESPVAMFGYSGGAIATQWAAELAPQYAPDVNRRLVGSAAGGLLVEPLRNLEYVDGSPMWKAVIPMAISGIARSHGVDVTPYLTERGKQIFAQAAQSCIVPEFLDTLVTKQGITWEDMVLPEYRDPENFDILQELGSKLVMGTYGTPTTPLLMRQGGAGFIEATANNQPGIGPGDGVMILDDARRLAQKYCDAGATVDYAPYPHFSHVPGFAATYAEALPWMDARFAGAPAPSTCGRF